MVKNRSQSATPSWFYRKFIGRTNTPAGFVFDVFNCIFLAFMALITLFPIWYIFCVSTSSYNAYLNTKFLLFPKDFTLSAYSYIFTSNVLRSFLWTAFVVVTSTLLHLLFTACCAYPLSKKHIKARKGVLIYILITMLFGGGIVPYYILVKNVYHLGNNPIVLILPGTVSGFSIILLKNFFLGIPPSLDESAKIDGAGDFLIMVKIYLPLSLPIISTLALFYGVGKWNDWFTAVLFIENVKLYPIQNILRKMIVEGDMGTIGSGLFQNDEYKLQVSIKMAVIIFANLPIMMVYPFLQKHFAKGVILGSIKE